MACNDTENSSTSSPKDSPNSSSTQSKKRSHDGAFIEGRNQSIEPVALGVKEEAVGKLELHGSEKTNIKSGARPSTPTRELTAEEAHGALCSIIDGIGDTVSGNFATSGTLPNAENPGLYVKGLGGIGMPLSEHDAHRVAGICHQAPFGKGSETIIDTKLRNTWELNPSQFELQNPAWQHVLNGVVGQVANGLGIALGAASIRAELYKLLLYEEGAFFSPHRDSEKAPGMLGTLVISLPSIHQGGAVEASFGKETRLLETAPSSRFGYSFLAWYADVEHAVQKITSGYRLVLTYNLIHIKQGTAPRAESHIKPEREIAKLLEAEDCQGVTYFIWPIAYVLDHKYTEANLRMDHLKGKDRAKGECLQRACQKAGLSMFLANMALEESGGCHEDSESNGFHEFDDETDRQLVLKAVVDLNGTVRSRDLHLEEENILQDSPFDRIPDDEDFSGWTGNEGVSATHFYRDSCILIMPDEEDSLEEMSYKASFSSPDEASKLLASLMKNWREADGKNLDETADLHLQKCRRRVFAFCDQFGSSKHSYYYDHKVRDDFVYAVLAIDAPASFHRAVREWSYSFLPSTYRKIGSALAFEVSEPGDWLKGVATAVQRSSRKIESLWDALTEVRQGFEASIKQVSTPDRMKISLESLTAWAEEVVATFLTVRDFIWLDAKDGNAIIKIAQEARNVEQILFRMVLPFVKSKIQTKPFVFAILRALYRSCQEKRVREEVVKNIYRDILSAFSPDLLRFQEADRLWKTGCGHWHESLGMWSDSPNPKGPRIAADPADLATLCGQCLSLGLHGEVKEILRSIVQKNGEYDIKVFESAWIPFLRDFLPHVNNAMPDPMLDECRLTTQTLIDNYIRRFLSTRPPPAVKSPTQLGCRACQPCKELDQFLADPKQPTVSFKIYLSERKHLQERIGNHYETTIERKRSPYQLVVHVKPEEYRAIRDAAEYRNLRVQLVEGIESIGTQRLNELLGTKGNELSDLDSPRNRGLVAGITARTPLGDLTGHENAKQTYQPGIDFIDLTKQADIHFYRRMGLAARLDLEMEGAHT